jgi:hypothetical protein
LIFYKTIPPGSPSVYCNITEILLAYDGSEPAEHAREVVFDRFDPDVVTVLFVFDPGEAGYEAPDPFGTDTELTELATERAEEVFTSFEVPGESDTTVRTVHEVGHPARTVVDQQRVTAELRRRDGVELLGVDIVAVVGEQELEVEGCEPSKAGFVERLRIDLRLGPGE